MDPPTIWFFLYGVALWLSEGEREDRQTKRQKVMKRVTTIIYKGKIKGDILNVERQRKINKRRKRKKTTKREKEIKERRKKERKQKLEKKKERKKTKFRKK